MAQAPREAPKTEPARQASLAGASGVRRGDPALDQKINQAREEIEFLELQLATKQAQLNLAEARLAEARRWRGHFEKLFRDGFASEERFLSARDDVLMHESRVAGEKAALAEAELRVKQAKRRMDYGEFPLVPQETRLAEVEQRLAGLERSVDLLQQEVGNLRRMLRPLWKMPDNVEREPVMKPR
ncbi:MAG: HlyD family secretion protein [Isosphaeraceae bacterium]